MGKNMSTVFEQAAWKHRNTHRTGQKQRAGDGIPMVRVPKTPVTHPAAR